MKHFLINLFIFSCLYASSQKLTELKIEGDKWQIEVQRTEIPIIEKMVIINTYVEDTVDILPSVIKNFNNSTGYYIITQDSLSSELNTGTEEISIKIKTNDSISYQLSILPESYVGDSYSIVFIDSAEINKSGIIKNCNKDYYGVSKQSLGAESKLEDCLATVTGKLYFREELQPNTLFFIHYGWNPETKGDSLWTDDEGNFTFETWPSPQSIKGHGIRNSCPSADIGGNFMGEIPGIKIHHEFVSVSNSTITPGINHINLLDFVANTKKLAKLTTLQCSPNPATDKITAEYSIPLDAHWKACGFILGNTNGQIILNVPVEKQEGKQEIELPEGIAKGIYFCSLTYKGHVLQTVQIVVK